MSGGFQVSGELCNGTGIATVGASSRGTRITCGGSKGTYGSWTQLIASTASDATAVLVEISGDQGIDNGLAGVVQIGIGAAASEVAIIPDLILEAAAGYSKYVYFFPIGIASGTRVSARGASNFAGSGDALDVQVQIFDSSFPCEPYAGVDSIGYDSTNVRGTVITASGSGNTKGSYSQIIASTSVDYAGILIGLDHGTSGQAVGYYLLDIAIGGAGSEVVIIPDLSVMNNGSGNQVQPSTFAFFPITIPSGTRIAARCQCSTASKTLGVTLYGVYQ